MKLGYEAGQLKINTQLQNGYQPNKERLDINNPPGNKLSIEENNKIRPLQIINKELIMKTEFFEKNVKAMHKSLLKAVYEAGGVPDAFSYEKIKDMPLSDLMEMLATNGIRFIYNKNSVIKNNKNNKK